jgi:hypothetical protein
MPTKGKTAKAKKATITEETEDETYLNYIVNFNNSTFNKKVVVKQTGKPKDPPPCPPGGC